MINQRTHTTVLSAAAIACIITYSHKIQATEAQDTYLRNQIEQHQLTGDPSSGRDLPSIDDASAQLGKQLFFTKLLSGNKDTACVSCHHPRLGGGDNLSLPIGVDAQQQDLLGPGRLHTTGSMGYDAGPTVPRNAPTTYNIGLWDKALFHDGRLESLGKTPGVNGADGEGIRTPTTPFGIPDTTAHNLTQGQAMFPVSSPEEMREEFMAGEDIADLHKALSERLKQFSGWQTAFSEVFSPDENNDVINPENLFHAIGEYERSQVFVENAWKRYVEGDDNALSKSQKRGASLFFKPVDEGGAGCVSCHSGDFFSDEQFHVSGFPQLGRGKGDGRFGDEDYGRYRETGERVDRFAFRTPSLLNVEYTAPYGHAGSFPELEDMIRYHAHPQLAFDYYPFDKATLAARLQTGIQRSHAKRNTRKAVRRLGRLIKNGKSKLEPRYLSPRQAKHLANFLRALSDKRIEDSDFMAKWIPADNEPDHDGMRLRAVDADGNPL